MDSNTTLKKSQIPILWNKHCSKCALSKSPSVERLAFLLSHYQLWIKKASQKTLDTSTEITCIHELINLLGNYNRPSLMDDFYDVKKLIEMENDVNSEDEKIEKSSDTNNNNNANGKSHVHEIQEYFQSILCHCKNSTNCLCFLRNRRPRSLDSIEVERRKAFYIRAEDIRKYGSLSRFEVREVILQSSLDVIHNYIFHAEDEQKNMIKSHCSKFITEIRDEVDSKNDETVKKLGKYSFGYVTNYWSPKNANYVPVKYPDLRTELTSNALHSISNYDFDTLEERARDILETKYGHGLKSRREHEWMEVNDEQLLPTGSLITEKHLVAVLSYTNKSTMQHEFKKHGFRKENEIEKEEDVRTRNSEIAHWSRAIYEVIHCWGSVMSAKKCLFHGINSKLLFNRFSHRFCMPTSLTTNLMVAKNFAKADGIILVLKHARENDYLSLMFDVSPMSDFPHEEEIMIFGTKAMFFDIILDDGPPLKSWMKALRVCERIRRGYFLSHVSISDDDQQRIVYMMDNYFKDKKSDIKKNVKIYENGNVPKYIQQLFNECTDDDDDRFYINSYAIEHTINNKVLLQYLHRKNSEFWSIFKNVRNISVYEWVVGGDEYESYFSDSHPSVVEQKVHRINLREESDDEPLFLEFHWELKNTERNGLLRCDFMCDYLPSEVTQVSINLGIFIRETKCETNVGDLLNHQKMRSRVLHSIVKSKRLLKYSEFNVKLRFAIRSCVFAVENISSS